jgi:energy-converting hydrogenase Eha subunit A
MKICISCETNVEGKKAYKVKEDRIIGTVRRIKKAIGLAKNNELYVCENCLQKHMEKRKSFEKSVLFGTVIAVVILVVLLGMLLLSGRFDIWAIVSTFIISGFVLALPLFKYAPALEGVPPSALMPSPGKTTPPLGPYPGPSPPPAQPVEPGDVETSYRQKSSARQKGASKSKEAKN